VYALLVIAAALVLTQRPAASGQKTVHLDTYSGWTAQGERLQLFLDGRRVESLRAAGIWATCRGRPRVRVDWVPSTQQANVSYHSHGSEFTVHERPDPRFPHPPGARANLYMRGNLNWDVRRVDGVISYFESGARGTCSSGPIRFGVSR
jgi:hypothetical protein